MKQWAMTKKGGQKRLMGEVKKNVLTKFQNFVRNLTPLPEGLDPLVGRDEIERTGD